MLTSIVLALLLVFCVFVLFAQFTFHSLNFNHGFKTTMARDVGPKLDECLIEDNDSRNKIAVITVDGIISSHPDDGTGYMSDPVQRFPCDIVAELEFEGRSGLVLKANVKNRAGGSACGGLPVLVNMDLSSAK